MIAEYISVGLFVRNNGASDLTASTLIYPRLFGGKASLVGHDALRI